ncbi:Ribonuclease H domain [Trinorchestia longiramus]|nr:Ribonuclease H domain [Trinorchestia longiramus]
MLDSPQLRWHQVEYLKQSCAPLFNLLQSKSHRHWGVDRELLIYLYKTLIRSWLDYAAPLYGTAALSNLLQLNSIQNHCLRVATGCRKTSPAASLEVEANIFPLTIRRDLLTCQYYSKLQQLPNDMADDLLQAQFPAEGLSSRLLPSMNSRARALFTDVNLQIPARNPAPLVSPLRPWFKVETYISTDFLPTSVSSQTNQNVLQMYHELIDTNYSGYTHIFTDGSCIVEPTCSASTAAVIPSRGVTINFKLRPQIHIMECELIAINEALQWILLNNCQEEKYVIFSDSLSSLHFIQNTRPKNYLPLVFNIQDKLFNIAASHWLYMQFIPGHKGIRGNEAADEAAKNAHLLRYRTLMPSPSEEVKNLTNTAFKTKWKTEWLSSIQLTGKGRHLLKIRDNTGQWPWSAHKTRNIETALARLRVGHTGLRSHLYRFSIVEDLYCSCGAEESIDHIFFSCPYYASERTTMKNSLIPLNVPFCLKNLLVGGLFLEPTQKQIVKIVANYLTSIRKIKTI